MPVTIHRREHENNISTVRASNSRLRKELAQAEQTIERLRLRIARQTELLRAVVSTYPLNTATHAEIIAELTLTGEENTNEQQSA